MKVLLFSFALLYSITTFSQITFRNAIGNSDDDIGACVRETDDFGFIVAGTTGSVDNTNSDIYLFKLDSLGGLLWSNHFGTSYGTENGKKVLQTIDKGYIIVGFTNSIGNGGYDAYVIKVDSIGQEVWSKTYGGPNWDFANDIILLPSANYGVVGSTYSFGNGDSDGFFLEIDDIGNEIGFRTFGGVGEEIFNSVTIDSDSKLLFCGHSNSYGNGIADGYVVKSELNGDTIWTRTFGGDSTDYLNDIIYTSDDSYMAVGSTTSFDLNNRDYYYIKVSKTGNLIYERHDGGLGEEEANEICESDFGNYSFIGNTTTHGAGGRAMQLFQITSDGWWLNSPQYGSEFEEFGYSIFKTHDDGFILSGITNGYNAMKYDVLVIKTDENGLTGNTGDVINITDDIVGIENIKPDELEFNIEIERDYLTVNSIKLPMKSVHLYDFEGKLILNHTPNQSKHHIQIGMEEITNGFIVVKINFDNGYATSAKFRFKN